MQQEAVEAALDAIAAGATADEVESRTLDFKRQGRSRPDTVKDLAVAAACFANAIGGVLVLGVADRVRGEAAVEGTDLDPIVLARRIYELTQPPLTVDTRTRQRSGRTVLEIHVPRSPEIHQVDGRATHRVGTGCLPLSGAQIAALVAERRGLDWSAEDTDLPLDRVAPLAIAQARQLLRNHPDPQRRTYATETDQDLLRVLGLVSPAGTLLRAGMLLFGDPTEIGTDLVVYQYRRTPAGEPALISRFAVPLLPAVVRTLELIDARVDKSPVSLPGGQQLQLADLPEVAVRESVVNAVVHRDYRRPGPVRIEHAPTRLMVASPGPLVLGVTVDNILTTSSRPRNVRLAAAVRTLGLAEEAGMGVDRMYREMVRVGHAPPYFVEDAEQVRVTLRGGAPNKPLTRYVSTLPQAEANDADAVLVLFTLLTRRTVAAEQLVATLQKGREEVEDVLRRLSGEDVGMIERTRETARRAHPAYRLREHVVTALGPALTYHRRTTDEYDRKIIELVRETGQVNGRLAKIALDLTTERASRILGDLVERQVLVKTSEAQRGPSVTYGPGPGYRAGASRRARRRPRGMS